MNARKGLTLVWLGLVALVTVASLAAAVRGDSIGPTLQIGWLPAVVVAAIAWPGSRGRCGRG